MKRLKKMDKEEILWSMFPEVGDSFEIEEVLQTTGIVSNASLKVIMCRLKNEDIFPKEDCIHLSQKNGLVVRLA